MPSNISYDDILERHGGAGGIPDPSHLTIMAKDLKQLSDLASARSDTCNAGMRALSEKRKEALDEERQVEQEARAREAEERETLKTLKKEAEEEDDEIRGRKGGKVKKKKERSSVREERPLAHGAHGLARQDGLDLPLKGTSVIRWLSANTPSYNLLSFTLNPKHCIICTLLQSCITTSTSFVVRSDNGDYDTPPLKASHAFWHPEALNSGAFH